MSVVFVLFSSGGTVTNAQLWISMTYGDFIPLIYKDIWLECTFLPSVIIALFTDIPNNIIILFLYNHMIMEICRM